MAKNKLRDVVIAKAAVYYSAEDYFEVRGIALADIVKLTQVHMEKFTFLFNDFMARKGDEPLSTEVMKDFLIDCVTDVPEIISEVIAIAADDHSPEGIENVKKLRTPVIIDALLQIAALSITTEAELKKLVEALTTALTKVTGLATMLKSGMDTEIAEVMEENFRFPDGVSAPVRESIN